MKEASFAHTEAVWGAGDFKYVADNEKNIVLVLGAPVVTAVSLG